MAPFMTDENEISVIKKETGHKKGRWQIKTGDKKCVLKMVYDLYSMSVIKSKTH